MRLYELKYNILARYLNPQVILLAEHFSEGHAVIVLFIYLFISKLNYLKCF